MTLSQPQSCCHIQPCCHAIMLEEGLVAQDQQLPSLGMHMRLGQEHLEIRCQWICLPHAVWVWGVPSRCSRHGVGRAPWAWGTPARALACGRGGPAAWPGTQCSRLHPPDTHSPGWRGGGRGQRPHSGASARFPGQVGWVSGLLQMKRFPNWFPLPQQPWPGCGTRACGSVWLWGLCIAPGWPACPHLWFGEVCGCLWVLEWPTFYVCNCLYPCVILCVCGSLSVCVGGGVCLCVCCIYG